MTTIVTKNRNIQDILRRRSIFLKMLVEMLVKKNLMYVAVEKCIYTIPVIIDIGKRVNRQPT